MNKSAIYKKWAEIVVKKKKWPKYNQWSNAEYTTLSNEISEATGTQISRNTIRNFIESINENDSDYQPQSATKDAFAKFIGYTNWEKFEKTKATSINKLFSILTVIVFLVGFIAWIVIKEPENGAKDEFQFSVENHVGTMPHTLNCSYDISKIQSDNVKLDYGHIGHRGNYLLTELDKNQNQIKQIFHYPGYFQLRLFIDDEIRFRKRIIVKSDDWFIYAADASDINLNIPNLIKEAKHGPLYHIPFDAVLSRTITDDGYFHIPYEQIKKLDHLSSNYNVVLKHIKNYDLPLRDISVETRFQTKSYGELSFCYEAIISLLGEKRNIFFRMVEKGCEFYAGYRIGTKTFYGGKGDELPFLILNFTEFNTVKIDVKNEEVALLINSEEVFQIIDSQDFGNLIGIQLQFKGTPYVDYIELKTIPDSIVFADYFDE